MFYHISLNGWHRVVPFLTRSTPPTPSSSFLTKNSFGASTAKEARHADGEKKQTLPDQINGRIVANYGKRPSANDGFSCFMRLRDTVRFDSDIRLHPTREMYPTNCYEAADIQSYYNESIGLLLTLQSVVHYIETGNYPSFTFH